MTRVNVVPAAELCDQHLLAEWREIARIPGNLKKSLNRKSKPFSMDEIPSEYILGSGHVKFFYDKMAWLQIRYERLTMELVYRGFNLRETSSKIFQDVPHQYFNMWQPDERAKSLNRQRIKERMPQKPRFTEYKSIMDGGEL